MTCWCVISLRRCRIMAVHKWKAFRLKQKKSFIAHPWCLHAVRCWPWGIFSSWLASRDLDTARSSYLAWVGPMVNTGQLSAWGGENSGCDARMHISKVLQCNRQQGQPNQTMRGSRQMSTPREDRHLLRMVRMNLVWGCKCFDIWQAHDCPNS